MRRNLKYVFATIPLIQYSDYKTVVDYRKCDYDATRMLQDKEYIAELIKKNQINFSDVLACSEKQKLNLLINSEKITTKKLVEYIETKMTNIKDMDTINIICSHLENLVVDSYELYWIERLIVLCPSIKRDIRLYKYYDEYIKNNKNIPSVFCDVFHEYVVDKCKQTIKSGEIDKTKHLIKFIQKNTLIQIINENMDFFDIDYVVNELDFKQQEIDEFIKHKFFKCKTDIDKKTFIEKYKNVMDINTIITNASDVNTLMSLTNNYIISQLFKDEGKTFRCLNYEITKKELETFRPEHYEEEYGYSGGCSCSAFMGDLLHCDHDPPIMDTYPTMVHYEATGNPNYKTNKNILLCWMLLKNNNLDMVTQIINKMNYTNDFYDILVYVYLNYSYDEFTNFILKTSIHKSCIKLKSELSNLRYKKLYIIDQSAKNEFIKTFDN